MSEKKPSPLNLPNVLSLIRMLLVPFFAWSVLVADFGTLLGHVLPAAIFAVTAFTDFLDGNIARKYNLVTNFGKFLDPLADKFMVFGAFLVLCARYAHLGDWLIWAALLVFFRDLAVTSLRLLAAGQSGAVIAASWPGKIKTVTQIIAVFAVLLEPLLLPYYGAAVYPISYAALGVMSVSVIYSGIDYFRAYLPVLDFNK